MPMSMPGLPGIELSLICLGELNAPKSCWRESGWDEAAECMPGGVCPFSTGLVLYRRARRALSEL